MEILLRIKSIRSVLLVALFLALSAPLQASAWWNESWPYRVTITIDPAQVDSTLTNFPVYVDLNDLPATFFDNVISGCGDVRVVESDDTTETAREIVFCNTGADTGELHFLADSVSASANTTFYIYYGNSGASDYADNATYGAENVWVNSFQAVYHFQGTPGTVEDSTANGYDASATNMDATNVTTGVLSGSGYSFNATDEQIQDTDQVWPNAQNEVTVSFWANAPATGSIRTPVAMNNGGERMFLHVPDSSNTVWDFGTCCGAETRLAGDYTAYDDKYTHVFAISNGTNLQTIYLDGASAYTKASADNPNVDMTGLTLGSEGGTVYYAGDLDEVRLATAVRDAAWADSEYTNQFSPTTFYSVGAQEAAPTGPVATIAKPPNNLGLVGYWPMNEATSTVAGDFSGRGNHAAFPGGSANPTWVSGKFGGALRFDGTGDYLSATDSGLPSGASARTFCAWFRSSSGAGYRIIGAWGTRTDADWFGILLENGTSYFDTSLYGYDLTTGVAGNDGVWHHGCVTYDGSLRRIYQDGVLYNNSNSAVTTALNGSLYFGQNGEAGEYFPGDLDDIRIYNRALGDSEVSTLYNSGAARLIASSKTLTQGTTLGPSNGLVGHWTFDGGDTRWTSASAGVAYDGSGNNNIGTLTSMSRSSAVAIGKLGQAFKFDGSDDYVSIPHSTSLDITGNAITLATWVKLDGGGDTDQQFVGKVAADGSHSDPWFAYQLAAGNVGASTFTTRFAVTTGGVYQSLTPSDTFSTGAWHHVVGVYNGATLRTYVDGIDIANTPVTGNINSFTSTTRLGVNGTVTERLKGNMDDVRTYNRALSAAEVNQLYRLGQAVIKQ